jgi:hypothetical protein
MARPPEKDSIKLEEVPGAPEWFAGFLGVLNRFLQQVRESLAGNLTVGENVAAKWVTLEVVGGETPKPFAVGLGARKAKAVLVGGSEARNGSVGFEALPGIRWESTTIRQPDGRSVPAVQVTAVSGLTSGVAGALTLLVIPE